MVPQLSINDPARNVSTVAKINYEERTIRSLPFFFLGGEGGERENVTDASLDVFRVSPLTPTQALQRYAK